MSVNTWFKEVSLEDEMRFEFVCGCGWMSHAPLLFCLSLELGTQVNCWQDSPQILTDEQKNGERQTMAWGDEQSGVQVRECLFLWARRYFYGLPWVNSLSVGRTDWEQLDHTLDQLPQQLDAFVSGVIWSLWELYYLNVDVWLSGLLCAVSMSVWLYSSDYMECWLYSFGSLDSRITEHGNLTGDWIPESHRTIVIFITIRSLISRGKPYLNSIWENHGDILCHLRFSISGNIVYVLISVDLCEQHFWSNVSTKVIVIIIIQYLSFSWKNQTRDTHI